MSYGAGRIISYLNELRYDISLSAVNRYLRYRLLHDEDELIYRTIVATGISTEASGNKLKERVLYSEQRENLLRKKDTRTGRKIIADTIKECGIKVIDG